MGRLEKLLEKDGIIYGIHHGIENEYIVYFYDVKMAIVWRDSNTNNQIVSKTRAEAWQRHHIG